MKRLAPLLLLFSYLAAAQPSRIELRSHFSPTLGTQKYYNIFLPEGYDHDSLRYPAIYLFRGHEREWANASEDASRRGNIKTVADTLFAQGKIGKMILVMPGMSQPGVDADFNYVTNDLIPHIDATFRTIPVRQKRGMDGFSYGGYDVLQLLRRSPEQFFTVGAYDGSYWVVDLSTFFDGTTEAYWSLLRPMEFLVHSTQAGNWASNLQLLAILAAHGISNGFDTLTVAPSSAHNWFFADLHMQQSLPRHWQHLLGGSRTISLRWGSPLPGSTVSGTIPVRWSNASPEDSGRTVVDYSRDRGQSWSTVYSSTSHDTSFLWNSVPAGDGTGYLFRVRFVGDTTYGFTQMGGKFTVNNPGNAAPEAGVLSPEPSQALSGISPIQWWADDADGDALSVSIDISPDNGANWQHLADTANTGTYAWNTSGCPNSTSYRLRIRVTDGTASDTSVTGLFSVYNTRPTLQRALIRHVAGVSDGTVTVQAANPAQLTGHLYRVSFHDSVAGGKTYSVADVDRGATVLGPTQIPSLPIEGPLFDGLRLVIQDCDPPRLSKDSTRWVSGASNLIPDVSLPSFNPGGGMITGVAYVSDYEIRISDHTVDTSASFFGWTPSPMNFTVRNVTEGHPVKILFTDLDNNRTIGPYDDVIILERDSLGGPMVTWELLFNGSALPVPPAPGDVFLLKILKPFRHDDLYEFRALAGGLTAIASTTEPGEFTLEQNFPNPFNGSTVVTYEVSGFGSQGSGAYGQVPEASAVRLVVYDMLGREVAVLVNEKKAPGKYTVAFDAGRLASGVYLCRLTAGRTMQVRKMLLVR